MPIFETHHGEIEATVDHYLVSGRNVGEASIRVGDILNRLTVEGIEAYGRDLTECPPGMTARLKLKRPPKGDSGGRYDLTLKLGVNSD